MKSHFALFARYNRWANGLLYDAAAGLTEARYRERRGAFFGSVHGTLNHLLVADRIWFARIAGTGSAPTRLNEILYDDFAGLRAARAAEDERIISVVEGIADFDADLTYSNTRGQSFSQPLREVLAHVFNHQTHHRGQAHALLTQLGQASVEIDLILYMRIRSQ